MHELSMTYHERKRAFVHQLLDTYFVAKRDWTIAGHYERVKPGPDGRVRTELNPIGTSRGRYSSSETISDEYSTNLQNLSKKVAKIDPLYAIRECIIPDPGMRLWAADYSGAEALLAAYYQEDWKFAQMMLDGQDVHIWAASHFFGVPEDQFSKEDVRRHIAKNLNFASQYKASPWKITETINREAEHTGIRMTQAQVEVLRIKLLQIRPLERWWFKVEDELRRNNNTLTNALGFTCTFHYPDPEKRLKEALAFYPQSTVASLIDTAMERTMDELDQPGRFEVLLQVHDEIFGQVRQDLVPHYAPRIAEILEERFEVNGREVFVPADFSVGENWGTMKEVH
jgi:DNA polymerase-1